MIIHNLPKEKSEFCIMKLLVNMINVKESHQAMLFLTIYDLAKQDHEPNLKEIIVDALVYYIQTDS